MNENALQIFTNSQFGEIRTIRDGDTILFCGVDVARALGYAKPQNAISSHCKGALKRGAHTSGGYQHLLFIPIGDLCRLAAKSQLDGADRFESWIFDEVVPAVLLTGSYSVEQRKPMTQLEQIAATMESVAALAKAAVNSERRINDLERAQQEQAEKLHGIAATFAAPPTSEETWQEYANSTINEIVESHGMNHQTYRRDLYDILERRARCDLNMRQKRMKKRMADAGKGVNEQKLATKLHIIAIDPKLRAIFDGVLREEQAKYLCNT